MARIAGVDLPREKRIEIGLTYIYGIGRKSANDILAATGVNPDVRVKDMDEDDVTKLRDYIDKNFVVEGDPVSYTHLFGDAGLWRWKPAGIFEYADRWCVPERNPCLLYTSYR